MSKLSRVSFVCALVASSALAHPVIRRQDAAPSIAGLDFPAVQTALTIPSGYVLTDLALGVGFQNYSCSAAGTYGTNQAIAQLYDAYELAANVGAAELAQVTSTAFSTFSQASPDASLLFSDPSTADQAATNAGAGLNRYGQHFFIPTPVSGSNTTSPRFHLVDGQSGQDRFSVGNVTARLLSPDGADNVAWVQLASIDGDLSSIFYRTHTQGGVPPASCDPADPTILSIPYTALYVFGTV